MPVTRRGYTRDGKDDTGDTGSDDRKAQPKPWNILGELREGEVALTDVRTPFMQLLEAMLSSAFFGDASGATNFFQNPQSMFQGMFPGAGGVPGYQGMSPGANPALAMLTGGFNTGGLPGGSQSGGAGPTPTGGGGTPLPAPTPAPPSLGPIGPQPGETVGPTQGTTVDPNAKFPGVDPTTAESTINALNLPMKGGEGAADWTPTTGRTHLPDLVNILQSFLGGSDPGSVYGFSSSFNRLGNLMEDGLSAEEVTGDWGKYGQFLRPALSALDYFGGLQSGDYALDQNTLNALDQFNTIRSGAGMEGFDLGNMNQYYGDAANWITSQLGNLGFDPSAIDFRAMGGLLDPNKPTLVGEAGPELIMNGQVMPLQTAQTGGLFTDPNIIPPPATDPGGGLTNPGIGGITPTTGAQAPGDASFGLPDMFGNIFGAGSPFANVLGQNPEMQAFDTAQNLLGENFFGQNPGQGVMDALQPKFQENLQFGLGEMANRAPSVSNSALQLEGTDLTQRALNDYNLLASQAMQQGLNQQLGGLGTLGQMAGQAGQNPFQRMLGAGQLGSQTNQGLMGLAQQQNQFQNMFGLQAQNQQFQQTVLPALQMLMSLMGMAGPTGYQTVARGG